VAGIVLSESQARRIGEMLKWFESNRGNLAQAVRNSTRRRFVTSYRFDLMYVKLTQVGGSAGNDTTQCSFTYTMKDQADQVLMESDVTPVSPEEGRTSVGKYVAADKGVARWDAATEGLKLLIAFEVPDVAPC
jgi:hypothetical protein